MNRTEIIERLREIAERQTTAGREACLSAADLLEAEESREEYRVVGRYIDGWPFRGPEFLRAGAALSHAQEKGPLREQRLQKRVEHVWHSHCTPWTDVEDGEAGK